MTIRTTQLEPDRELVQGFPGREPLLDLLNEAFEGWGSEAYFRWKYDQYPGYDAERHNFYVADGGDVVAARRLFPKELVFPDGDDGAEFFAHGGTAVASDYRRQGLFSELSSASREYSAERNAPLVMTFNRKGKITTDVHLEDGWDYRPLPIYLRILSPKAVVEEYAETLLETSPLLDELAPTLAPLIGVSDGRLDLEDEDARGTNDDDPDLALRLSDEAVRDAVEIVGDVHDPRAAAELVGRRLLERDVGIEWRNSVRGGGGSGDTDREGRQENGETGTADLPDDVVVSDGLDDDELADVRSLFAAELEDYDVAFRREREDIVHQTRYPSTDVLTVTEEDQITGYAAVGQLSKGAVTEARVLDAVAEHATTFQTLVRAIERRAAAKGADVVVLASERDPGDRWARTETEYVMWDWIDRDDELRRRLEGDWRLTVYDAV